MTRRHEVCEKHPDERLLADRTCARCLVSTTFRYMADIYGARARAGRPGDVGQEPVLLGDECQPPAMRDGFFTVSDIGWPSATGEST